MIITVTDVPVAVPKFHLVFNVADYLSARTIYMVNIQMDGKIVYRLSCLVVAIRVTGII
jgi:hypothetical protein